MTEYKPTQAHENADELSRLLLPWTGKKEGPLGINSFNVAQLDTLPVTATLLGQATRRDKILVKVWCYTSRDGCRHSRVSHALLDKESRAHRWRRLPHVGNTCDCSVKVIREGYARIAPWALRSCLDEVKSQELAMLRQGDRKNSKRM